MWLGGVKEFATVKPLWRFGELDEFELRHDARGKYRRHVSGTEFTDTTTHAVERGAWHGRASRIPASSGVRSRFVRLQGLQAAATFSQ